MRSLTYVSGPPCSGKSVACEVLSAAFPDAVRIAGDRYWTQNESLAFQKRVPRTNEMIIHDLSAMTQHHVLLEWVPASGRFRDELQRICESQGRVFNQIVIYANAEELRKRKMARDGDEEIVEPDAEGLEELSDALVLDTTDMTEIDLQEKCVSWLQARL